MLENLKPNHVWEIFENLFLQTPRCSKHEEQIREKILAWVEEQNKTRDSSQKLHTLRDEIGNVFIRAPATPGLEKLPPILMQGHMDMVCESLEPIDFEHTPITPIIEDNQEWVTAKGTTLGADDGIGVSLALGLIIDPNAKHGPIEIVITIDEETGLTGAFDLDEKLFNIESKYMLNLDSEDLGIITIGSAGGGETGFRKNLALKTQMGEDLSYFQLIIDGLNGGHSGVDIALTRASANVLGARILLQISESYSIYLGSWNGGNKHNAITRKVVIEFAVPKSDSDAVNALVHANFDQFYHYYHDSGFEPEMHQTLNSIEPLAICSVEDSKDIILFTNSIIHGVIQMSPQVKGLVETSNNLAIIQTTSNAQDLSIFMKISTRSSIDADIQYYRRKFGMLAEHFGFKVEYDRAYPGWEPDPKAPLLQFVKSHYEKVYNNDIIIEAIHAGLETGVIGAKVPGIQMVSIGPTVKNPHTPDERVKIADVAILYELLKNLVQDFANL